MTGLPEDAEQLFRTFMNESPLAAWIVDDEDRLIYASEPFPLNDDQLGASMWDLVPQSYREPYRQALRRARRTGETQTVTAPGPRSGGEVGWFQAFYFSLPGDLVGGVGLDVTDLMVARRRLEQSQQRLVAAGDEARRRIERDLHDGVQQRLVVLLLRLRAMQRQHRTDPAAAAETIESTIEDLEEAVREVREVARGIHPSVLTKAGLGAALKGLVSRAGLPVQLRCSVEARLPETIEVATYFVCSESLTNITKHARATAAEISVDIVNDAVVAVISDDGVGGVEIERGGGLEGLRDRVHALGGGLEITSPAGGGTSVRSSIPQPATSYHRAGGDLH